MIKKQIINQLNRFAVASRLMSQHHQNQPKGQQRVLNILSEEDGLIQSYIAELLDLKPSSLTELVKKLESKGAVKRVEDCEDKRIKRLYITDVGRALVVKEDDEDSNSDQLLNGLTEAELYQLSELLDKAFLNWDVNTIQQTNKFMSPVSRLKAMHQFKQEVERITGKKFNEVSHKEIQEIRIKQFGKGNISEDKG